MNTNQLQPFHTLVRAGERMFIGIAYLERKPQYNDYFVIAGTTLICKNKNKTIPLIAEVDIHRHAPLDTVCTRLITTEKFKELSEEKREKYHQQYFATVPVLDLCEV